MIERRKFLLGMAGLIAAPAVVKASSLMPVKSIITPKYFDGGILPVTRELPVIIPRGRILFSQLPGRQCSEIGKTYNFSVSLAFEKGDIPPQVMKVIHDHFA